MNALSTNQFIPPRLVAGLIFLDRPAASALELAQRLAEMFDRQGARVGVPRPLGDRDAEIEIEGRGIRVTVNDQHSMSAAATARLPDARAVVELALEGSAGGTTESSGWRLLARCAAMLASDARADFVQWPEEQAMAARVEMTAQLANGAAQPAPAVAEEVQMSRAAQDRLRLATWMITFSVAIFALPVGAALTVINLFKGEDLRLSAQAMAVTGLIVTEVSFGMTDVLGQLPLL